uniref:Uncharacterized protein n=1 Tax=Dunaliella tertiolecta TaxID=3047 RepID=A0A7S3VJK5_DUNTE
MSRVRSWWAWSERLNEQGALQRLILHHALADKWGAAVAGQQECNAGGDDADEVERMVGGKATVEVGGEGQRMEARVALGWTAPARCCFLLLPCSWPHLLHGQWLQVVVQLLYLQGRC